MLDIFRKELDGGVLEWPRPRTRKKSERCSRSFTLQAPEYISHLTIGRESSAPSSPKSSAKPFGLNLKGRRVHSSRGQRRNQNADASRARLRTVVDGSRNYRTLRGTGWDPHRTGSVTARGRRL